MKVNPKELVKALRHCSNDYPCKTCPVELQKDESTCIGVLFKHCIDQIERDQKEIADLRKELEWKDMVIAFAQKKQTEAEAERDEAREKMPQWLNVSEKMPTDHLKRYLISFKDAGGGIVDMARYIHGLGWECNNWEVPQELITHWMPLPEPPKEAE